MEGQNKLVKDIVFTAIGLFLVVFFPTAIPILLILFVVYGVSKGKESNTESSNESIDLDELVDASKEDSLPSTIQGGDNIEPLMSSIGESLIEDTVRDIHKSVVEGINRDDELRARVDTLKSFGEVLIAKHQGLEDAYTQIKTVGSKYLNTVNDDSNAYDDLFIDEVEGRDYDESEVTTQVDEVEGTIQVDEVDTTVMDLDMSAYKNKRKLKYNSPLRKAMIYKEILGQPKALEQY